MDELDIYNMILDMAQYELGLRNALARQAPATVPAYHYHCSCCGRIIIPQGTQERFPRRWFRAIVNAASATRSGLNYVVHDVYRILGRFKLDNAGEAWLNPVRYG